jgi:hypothetical protein
MGVCSAWGIALFWQWMHLRRKSRFFCFSVFPWLCWLLMFLPKTSLITKTCLVIFQIFDRRINNSSIHCATSESKKRLPTVHALAPIFFRQLCPSVPLSVCLSVCLCLRNNSRFSSVNFVHLPVCLLSVSPSVRLSVCLYPYVETTADFLQSTLSIFPSICMAVIVRLSVCLSVFVRSNKSQTKKRRFTRVSLASFLFTDSVRQQLRFSDFQKNRRKLTDEAAVYITGRLRPLTAGLRGQVPLWPLLVQVLFRVPGITTEAGP